MKDQRITNILGWVIFLLVLTVYMITLEPVASFWDSGEYIASSYKLEIPHPPGGPLFLLLGRLFSFLSFGGVEQVAWAINTLSAVSSAFAVMFLFWIIVRISKKVIDITNPNGTLLSWGAGAVGAFSFAFTDTFWVSATETELYGIATLFIAMVFWAIFKWEEKADSSEGNRWLILISFMIGLSVGIHLLSLLAIPSLGLVYYFKNYRKSSYRGIFIALACSGGFLIFVLYGLVTLANISKVAEIWLVNSFSLPFGSGVLLVAILLLAGLVYAIRYSLVKNKVTMNTILLCMSFVLIGYMSYGVVLVRANFGPPINQNDPRNVLGLIYYLNMEQYPSRPLLYGKYFNAPLKGYEKGKPVYTQKDGKYVVTNHSIEHIYPDEYQTIFPRAYNSQRDEYATQYRDIMGLKKGEKPSFSDNLTYLFTHQTGHMFLRYFMWNFAGREGSFRDAGWLSPLDSIKKVPDPLERDKARNNYLMLPLILGLTGMFFLYRRDKKSFAVVGMLFFMTGFALVLYLNSPPSEPRERDYIYVGSYFAFAIWLGIGTIPLVNVFRKLISADRKFAVIAGTAVSFIVPVLLIMTNYDDHDRSEKYFSVQNARNTLAACEKDAILFTGGDNDTYPLWYVQEVEGFRTDVRVVVLSYSNVDWYINPLYDKKNESEPLPLSLDKEDYIQGGLVDYTLVSENPNFRGRTVSVNKYLDLIGKRYDGIIHETNFGKMAIVPSRKLQSYVDSSQMHLKEDLPEVAKDKLTDKFIFEITGNGLDKKDMLILDILDTNKWKRPVYFNLTSRSQVNFDLTGRTVQVADIYRVLPLDLSRTKGREELVDTKKMYDNLVNRSSYDNMDRDDIHYSENYILFTLNRRGQFNTLIKELIREGDLDTAKNVLHKVIDYFPENAVPYDFTSIDLLKYAMVLDENAVVEEMSDTMYHSAKEWLSYADERDELKGDMRTNLHLYTLSELSRAFFQAGDVDNAGRFRKLLEKHYRG